MKKWKIICCMPVFWLTAVCPAQTQPLQKSVVDDLVARIKAAYAPERREAVFAVSAVLKQNEVILSGEVQHEEAHRALVKGIRDMGAVLKDELVILPDSLSRIQPYGIVRLSVCQVRGAPANSAELVTQAVLGAEVSILKTVNGWHYVQMEDRYLGWIKSSALVRGDRKYFAEWQKGEHLIVQPVFCRAFSAPSLESDPVTDLVRGNRVTLLGKKGAWLKIGLPDGRSGYIESGNALTERVHRRAHRPHPDRLINAAKASLGAPYLWGGSSVKGFDCSGFVQSVYRFHGVQLRRDAGLQAQEGMAVSLTDELERVLPGDLLFFGSDPDRITHVGMYIGGKRYIHASGMVKINSFDPEHEDYDHYLHVRLRSVRRILDPQGLND